MKIEDWLNQLEDIYTQIVDQHKVAANEQRHGRDTGNGKAGDITNVPSTSERGTDSTIPNTPAATGSTEDTTSPQVRGINDGQRTERKAERVIPSQPTEVISAEDAKVTVLQGVTEELAAEERKKPFDQRNIFKVFL